LTPDPIDRVLSHLRHQPEIGENPMRSRHCDEGFLGVRPGGVAQPATGRAIPEEEITMAQAASLPYVARAPIAIPVREWAPWAIFAGVIMLFLLYLVGCDQGALSLVSGHYLHEWVHDARHLLGFPCH
jgi:hypothetical protein